MSAFVEQRPFCLIPRSRTEWLASGLAPRRLRAPLYRRTSLGYYVPMSIGRNGDSLMTTQRVLDAGPLIPATGALGGWAAAFVHGVDWLDGVDRTGEVRVPVHVGSLTGRSRSTARFILDELAAGEVDLRHDLRVTSLCRTAFDVVRWSPDLSDAVAALDAMLRFTSLTLEAYLAELTTRDRWRGVHQARAAADLADPNVLSSAESRLRVLYVNQAQLPRPLVNPWIFDQFWVLCGRPDLYDPVVGHAIEYDGAYHEAPTQQEKDGVRQEHFRRLDIRVTRVNRADFASHSSLVSLLRRDRLHVSIGFDPTKVGVVPAGATAALDGRPVPQGVIDMIERLTTSTE